MSTPFRPMLATDFDEMRLRFPYFATPKLDGIRCLVMDGEAKTRSMKLIPNRYVREWFRAHASEFAGMDGELIVGEPTAKDCYSNTVSHIMRETGQPAFTFYVFDIVDPVGSQRATVRSLEAIERLRPHADNPNIRWLESAILQSRDKLRAYEEAVLKLGYEGVMLRHPDGRYKQGRATVNENLLLKVKRFRDAEAVVVAVEEQQHNTNVGVRNAIGRTQRSSAKAGLVGKGTAGTLIVRGAPGQPFEDITFGIGTGFNDELRAQLWSLRYHLPGTVVRYRYCEIGIKDAPRFPVFTGFRQGGA